MIVQYHSGEISAESEPGAETTITVRFPREFTSPDPVQESQAA
jgi:signal transduction histidine kinase